MARPKLKEAEKLIVAQTRISIPSMTRIEQIAKDREWSISQTLRKLIERGLDSEQQNITQGPSRPARKTAAI